MADVANFECHRKRLLSIAYRMLGSRADAEDIVQEAWFKWEKVDLLTLNSEEAWLVTVVTRLCLDKLRQARRHRDNYQGQWLPEPVLDADALDASTSSELADDLSYALLLTLERLSPLERAAFLLHDVFDVSFLEIAEILERSDAAVRQLASRARKAIRENRPGRSASPEKRKELLLAFFQAMGERDAAKVHALLCSDAVYLNDSGGNKPAALRPIISADKIVRLFAGVWKKFPLPEGAMRGELADINGEPGSLVYVNENIEQMITVDVRDDKISVIYVVSNPEKLGLVGFPNRHKDKR